MLDALKRISWPERATPYMIGALIGGLAFAVFNMASPSPCSTAHAQALCPVANSSVFSGTYGMQSGSAYTATFDMETAPTVAIDIAFPTEDGTVAYIAATQTLTNKTITSPTIGTPTITSPTITTSPTAVGATWTDLGSVTTVDINGGSIDGITSLTVDADLDFTGPQSVTTSSGDLTLTPTIDVIVSTGQLELNDALRFDTAVADITGSLTGIWNRSTGGGGRMGLNVPSGDEFNFFVNATEIMSLTTSAMNFTTAHTISTSAGDLTIGAAAGSDVLIGDDVTLLYVDGGHASLGLGMAGSGTSFMSMRPGGATRTASNIQGAVLYLEADTQNFDNSSSTIAQYHAVSWGTPTWTNNTATLTITDASTVHIQGAPIASSNVDITNAYSLWVDGGTSRFDGHVEFNMAGQSYEWADRNNWLTLQGQKTNTNAIFELFPLDGDGNDDVQFSIYGSGVPSDTTTDMEKMSLKYDAAGRFEIIVQSAGTGSALNLVFYDESTPWYTLHAGGGFVMNGATGGDQGGGTINATGVYDDGVLLVDWVFDLHYDGKPNLYDPFWRDGNRLYELAEVLDLTAGERHLPWMPARLDFENSRSLGNLLTGLWQGQEQQQIYLFDHDSRLKSLEAEVDTLEARLAALEAAA